MVKIFFEDGIITGAFSDVPDENVEVISYDRDLDSKKILDKLWSETNKKYRKIIPVIIHPGNEVNGCCR